MLPGILHKHAGKNRRLTGNDRRIIPVFSRFIPVFSCVLLFSFVFLFLSPSSASAATSVYQGSLAMPLTDTTQQITVGFQPKAMIFYWTLQTATGQATTGAYAGMGFATGTTDERCISTWSDVNDPTDNGRLASETYAIWIQKADGATAGRATISAVDSTSFTLSWSSTDGSQNLVQYMAIGGNHVSASAAGTMTLASTGATQSISSLTFQPAFVMFLSANVGTTYDTNTAEKLFSLGYATDASNEAAVTWGGDDAAGNSNTVSQQRTDSSILLLATDMTQDAIADFTSMDTNGFTLNVSNTPAANTGVFYLAIAGPQFDVGSFTSNAGTGNQNVPTDGSFTPVGVFLAGNNLAASTAIENDAYLSIGSAQSSTARGAIAGNDRDGDNSADPDMRYYTTLVYTAMTGTGPTTLLEGDFVSFASSQFTVNWTTAVARPITFWAIGNGLTTTVSGTVYLANETTQATTGNGGPCNSSTSNVSIRSEQNLNNEFTGTCSSSDASYSIDILRPASGTSVYVYQTSSSKANTVYVSDGGATDSGMNMYIDRVAFGDLPDNTVTIPDLWNYDSTTDDTNMMYNAVDNSPDTLTVEAGKELHVITGKTLDPGGTVTISSGANGDVHVDDSATIYFDTATNSLAEDVILDASSVVQFDTATTITGDVTVADAATVNFDADVTVSGGDITVTSGGDVASTTGTVTLGATGANPIGGGSTGSVFQLTNLTISAGTTTLGSDADNLLVFNGDISVSTAATLAMGSKSADVNGGNLTTAGTGTVTCSSCTSGTVTLSGDGSTNGIGGGGTVTLYSLTLDGASNTTQVSSALTVMHTLTVNTTNTLQVQGNNLTVGDNGVSGSGILTVSGTGVLTQTTPGTTTIKGLDDSTAPTITLSSSSYFYNLDIGPSSADNTTYTVNLGSNIDVNNDLTIRDAGASDVHTLSAGSYQINVGDAWVNNDVFTAGTGKVVMDATDASGNALSGTMTGSSAFNNLEFNGTGGTFSFSNDATVNGNFTITAATSVTAPVNLFVKGNFTGGSAYQHNSGTLALEGAGGSTQTIAGTTTFYTLVATASASRTIQFTASTTYTVHADGNLTLEGTSCTSPLFIKSTSTSANFTLTKNAGGNTDLDYLNIYRLTAGNALTASNSVDSGNNSNITISAGSCIGGGTDANATGYSFQRKTVYDAVNSYYYMFFWDGDEIEIKYSSDGSSWTRTASLSYDTNDFSIWKQDIGGTVYLFLAVASGNDIIIRRATFTATPSLSWDTAGDTANKVLAFDATGSQVYANTYVSADSSGYLWVMARYFDGLNYMVKVTDSVSLGNVSDGSFNVTNFTWNTASQLAGNTAGTNVYGNIVPLSTGDMYGTFVIDTALSGCVWDDSAGTSGLWLSSIGGSECGTTETAYYFNARSADDLNDTASAGRQSASTTLGASSQTFTLDGTNTTFYVLTDSVNKKYSSDRSLTTDTTGEKRNIDIAVESDGDQVAVWEDSRNSQSSNNTWTAVSGMNTVRKFHSATLLPSGRVLVTGGSSPSILSASEVFDPVNNSWSVAAGMNTTRSLHTATLLPSGRVLVTGGTGASSLSASEVFDPSSNSWSVAAGMNTIRYAHTATLLPSGRVLVAGGYSTVALSNSEVFDPSSNSWSVAAGMNTIREYHSATLLPNGRVLVAGGFNGSASLSVSEVYDPSSNSWSVAAGMNTIRYEHTATLLASGRVLVAGGLSTVSLSNSEVFDPASNSWSVAAGMNTIRGYHSATLLPNGRVLVAGGYDGSVSLSNSEVFDPVNNSWSVAAGMNTVRNGHSATLLPNGRVLVTGGSNGSDSLSNSEVFTPITFDIYAQKYDVSGTAQWNSGVDIKVNSDDGARSTASGNPSLYDHLSPKVKLDGSGNAIIAWSGTSNNVFGSDIYSQKLQGTDGAKLWPSSSTNTWTSVPGMNTIRRYHTATLLPNGRVLVAGGLGTLYLSNSEVFDPSSNSWSIAAGMNTIRGYHTATLLPNGRVLVAGGYDGSVSLSNSEVFDPVNNSWSVAAGMNTIRYNHSVTLLPNGRVLVAGGLGTSYLSNSEVYDPVNNSWSVAAGMNTRRHTHSATLLPNGRVLVAGGFSTSYLSNSEVYDPVNNSWSVAAGMNTIRGYQSATLLPNGRVLVAGGTSGSALSNSEIFDPSGNSWSVAAGMNTIRYDHTETLLASGRVLVAGGTSGSALSASEIYTSAHDITVSNDGSSGNWLGYGNPYYPEIKGLVGAQTNPSLAIDSGGEAIIVWEDDRYSQIVQNRVSFDYGASPATPPIFSINLAQGGYCNGGGTTSNSCGFRQAILGSPIKIMGQKLTDSTGAKNWGNAINSINTNNPEDIVLSATGDSNRNPVVEADGTDVILAWDTNAAEKSESGNLKRESNIYTQKYSSTGSALWRNPWSFAAGMNTIRNYHTATLLPNGRVLVAGGSSGSVLSNSEVFDPVSNSWSVAAGMNTIRYKHTATLLASGRVLVAGGDSVSVLSNSEVFDPASNSWSVAAGMNTIRYDHTATLLPNGRVLVAGGYDSSVSLSNSEVFDPASNSWSVAAGMNTVRDSHSATLLPSGRVLVAGGVNTSGASLSNSEVFDPVSNSWSVAAGMNNARTNHTATLLASGRVLVAGGGAGSSLSEVYDPARNSWSVAVGMNTLRGDHTATLLPNGRVLVAGGGSILTSSEVFDPASNSWSVAAGMKHARIYHTATLLASGRVLVAGGGNVPSISSSELYSLDQMVNTGSDLVDQTNPDLKVSGTSLFYVWQGVRGSSSSGSTSGESERGGLSWQIFGQKTNNPSSGTLSKSWPDGTENSWTAASGMNTIRRDHGATLLPNGRVLVAGGYDSSVRLSNSEVYDPSGNSWSVAAGMNTLRGAHTATLLPNGRVLVAGGNSGTTLSTSEVFDPASNSWSVAAGMNTIRYYHTATLLPNGRVLVAGGYNASVSLSNSEVYDPVSNSWSVAAGMNTIRRNHTATLLASGRVLVAGGYSGTTLSTSEVFDPVNNSWSVAAGMNTVRYGHTATLLPNGRVLVAGGGSTSLSNSEVFDPSGNSWSVAAGMNTVRYDHTATLLASGRVLVAGGYNASVSLSNSEVYDPASNSWSVAAGMNTIRRYHSATLLPNGRVLVAGGLSASSLSNSEYYIPVRSDMLLSHDFALTGDKANPRIVIDSGNPVVAWSDNRPAVGNYLDSSVTHDFNVFAQKFDGTTGTPLWPAGATTGGYTSPYTVMDIRIDTLAGGIGTHYSGKPTIGLTVTLGDGSKRIIVGFEDSRNDTSATSGYCGYSNTSSLIRVCVQSYDINQQSQTQSVDWSAYFYMSATTTPSINVAVAAAEWDGVQTATTSATQVWTTCTGDCSVTPEKQTLTWSSGGAIPPPSDVIGNMTFRRYAVYFTRTAGSVTLSYDNTNLGSYLGKGTPGTVTAIDTVVTGLSKNLSVVSDDTNFDVHLAYIDDDPTTDQVAFKKWDNANNAWDPTPAGIATSSGVAYPSISIESATHDLAVYWIDTTSGDIDYKTCDRSAAASECSKTEDWAASASPPWKNSGATAYTNLTSNYERQCETFAEWTVGTAAPVTVDWDNFALGGGGGETTYTQDHFEWFTTANSVTLSNPWPGSADSSKDMIEDQIFYQLPASNDPIESSDQIRVQMNFIAAGGSCSGASLPVNTQRFAIQYATASASTCSSIAGGDWRLIGGKTDTQEQFRLFNEVDIGDSTEQVNDISTSTTGAEGYYSEINYTALNPNAVSDGQHSEWDWPVENYSASENETYCFRMVKHDGATTVTAFTTYDADSYPKLTTAPGMSNLGRHGRIWQNDAEQGFYWAN